MHRCILWEKYDGVILQYLEFSSFESVFAGHFEGSKSFGTKNLGSQLPIFTNSPCSKTRMRQGKRIADEVKKVKDALRTRWQEMGLNYFFGSRSNG
jgi:hypothetical protein